MFQNLPTIKAVVATAAISTLGCSRKAPEDYGFKVSDLPGSVQLERIDQLATGQRSDGARFFKYSYIRGKITTALVLSDPATAMSADVRSVADLNNRCGFLAVHPEGRAFFGEIQKLLGTEVKFFRLNERGFEIYASTDGTGVVIVDYSQANN